MNLQFRFLFFLLFLFQATTARSSPISRNDTFAMAKEDYTDIRIDYDRDGILDAWVIKDKNVSFKYYKDDVRSYVHIQGVEYPRMNLLITTIGEEQRIQQWVEKSKRTFSFTQELCADQNLSSSNLKEVLTFPDITSEITFDDITLSLIDESCDNVLDNYSTVTLQNSIALLLNNSEKSLQACLGKTVTTLPLAKITRDIKLAGANAELNIKKFLDNPKEIKPLIFCEVGESKFKGNFSGGSASYLDSKIVLLKDKTKKTVFKDQQEANKVLMHEYLHHLGVEDEVRAELITAHCNGDADSISINPSLAGNQSLALASANKAQEIVAANNQGISKAAAETVRAIPSSPSAAPAQMAQIHKAAGESGVEAVSRSQTSGMLASANNLMGLMGTRATAATKSTASSTRTPSSTGTASRYKADSLVTTKSRVKSKAGKAQAGETMVEEYVLGQGSTSAATRRRASSRQSTESAARQPANVVNDQATAAPTASMEKPRRQGGSETAPGRSGGNSRGGISSLPNSSGSAARRPANAGSRSSSSSNPESTSTEEYVTYFTQSNYLEVKQKLKDTEFINKLKEVSITVLDLRGTVYGAEKGSVILLDRGDRFVPQK